jgi:hypothetical protein
MDDVAGTRHGEERVRIWSCTMPQLLKHGHLDDLELTGPAEHLSNTRHPRSISRVSHFVSVEGLP